MAAHTALGHQAFNIVVWGGSWHLLLLAQLLLGGSHGTIPEAGGVRSPPIPLADAADRHLASFGAPLGGWPQRCHPQHAAMRIQRRTVAWRRWLSTVHLRACGVATA